MHPLPNLISYYCFKLLDLVGWVTTFGYLRHYVNDLYDEILENMYLKLILS